MSGDNRIERKPVSTAVFPTLTWVTSEGHAAKETALRVNMLVERVDIIISSVTGNPTVTVTFANEDGAVVIDATEFATLADGTTHMKLAVRDFYAVPVDGTVTCTVDPSADAGGSAQTLSVQIKFRGP